MGRNTRWKPRYTGPRRASRQYPIRCDQPVRRCKCTNRVVTLSRATFKPPSYPSLFDVLQTAYNTGGETTAQFRLPNLKGSVPVGLDESQTEFNAMGKRGGSKISTAPHTHSTSHSHTASSSASTSITSGGSHVHRVANNITLVNTGTTFGAPNRTGTGEGWDTESSGSHSHTASTTVSTTVNAPNTTTSGDSSATLTSGNLQPYITLNYIIKI